MSRTILAAFGVLLFSASLSAGEQWPQFQGPNRDGVSTERIPLASSWPEAGPKLLWKCPKLGTGFGGPIVEGGKIYILDRVGDQQDMLRCLDLATGAQDWIFAYDAPPEARADPKAGRYAGNYNGSRNLPAADDDNVYIVGPFGDVQAVSKQTHQPLWSHNLFKEYGARTTNWGFCQSPVLHKANVIVAPLSKQAGIVAFDRKSGKEAWKSVALGDVVWTSPLVATLDGVDQVISLNTRDEPRLAGLDAATGAKLWEYRGWKCPNPVASPIVLPENRIFVTGGYDTGGALVRVSRAAGQWRAEEVFNNKACSSQGQNPLFYGGYIYANSSGNQSGVLCLGLNGVVRWKTSNDSPEEIGNLLIADGKIFSLLSEKGILRMIEAKPDGYKELASAKLIQGANIWGTMAIADGKLLVRYKYMLHCFDLRAETR